MTWDNIDHVFLLRVNWCAIHVFLFIPIPVHCNTDLTLFLKYLHVPDLPDTARKGASGTSTPVISHRVLLVISQQILCLFRLASNIPVSKIVQDAQAHFAFLVSAITVHLLLLFNVCLIKKLWYCCVSEACADNLCDLLNKLFMLHKQSVNSRCWSIYFTYLSTHTVHQYKIHFFHYFGGIWPYWKMDTGKHNFQEILLWF